MAKGADNDEDHTMSDDAISISTGPPETVMPPLPVELRRALDDALAQPIDLRRSAVAQVATSYPRFVDPWAALVDLARDTAEGYAYARVGYHRGLDTLRGSGWRGTGYVRWRHPENRGFLSALDSLRRLAGVIGEQDEQDRCGIFLRQLDPEWDRLDRADRS
jgi:hypothetical protein